MSVYPMVLFLHILGAVGLFVTMGLEWIALRGLRGATTVDQVRSWLSALAPTRWLGAVSFLALLVPGMYMTATAWGGQPWIGVAMVSLILMAVVGAVITGRRIRPIGRMAAEGGDFLSMEARQRLRDPLLWRLS